MPKIIFHIDVNSAFLSWEAVYRLRHKHASVDLREIPSVVGGNEENRHGIVAAKSLPCKPYKIKTGESLMEARQKCKDLVVVPPHYQLYERCSKSFISILEEYTPDVEQYSIDEAFLDMTGTEKLWGDPLTAAKRIREHVNRKLGFTINIGISHNKLLSKMASDFSKPNRIHTLWPEEVPEKMWPLPVSDLFYVGPATTKKLNTLGIYTIGELAKADVDMLKLYLKSHGVVVWNYANGFDISSVATYAPDAKGYGNSTTTPYDICDMDNAKMVLLSLSETIGMRLRKDGAKIEVVSVTIKYNDFSRKSHQKVLRVATDITNEIYHAAVELYGQLWDFETPVRHMGIRTSRASKSATPRQISLFDIVDSPLYDPSTVSFEKQEKLDRMSDEIRMNFGMDALKRAKFVKSRIDFASGAISRDKMEVDYSNQIVV